jgi:nicotinamide phosphoribosyltransferase
MKFNPLTAIDFYKADHRRQYPVGTELVYSNFTPRSEKLSKIPAELSDHKVVFFGLQYFIKSILIDGWNAGFFNRPRDEVVAEYKRRMDTSLGNGAIPVEHIEALHDLGYLPICIRALPEGSCLPIKVPALVIYNTHPEFFWLTNYLETILSCYLWKPMTSATVARAYRRLLDEAAERTGADSTFTQFQAHDFSFRGMSGLEDAALSGAGHLTSFVGTDTVVAIDLLEDFYKGNATAELLGCSVPATEHSVMCMGGVDDEIGTFRRLITDLYPAGIVSIVSDTWDFWKVVTEYASVLKADIFRRDGKLVFRPDSGDPVKIICGDPAEPDGTPAFKGAVQCLWELFGGTETGKGFKVLDSHVGLIYGDSITLERASAILAQLEAKGFASSNIVFGVGSFTYEYATRDTFGFAVKSTFGRVNGEGREIFKQPKTDTGEKNSARGLIKVISTEGQFSLIERCQSIGEPDDQMREVFKDGVLLVDDAISTIRERLQKGQA